VPIRAFRDSTPGLSANRPFGPASKAISSAARYTPTSRMWRGVALETPGPRAGSAREFVGPKLRSAKNAFVGLAVSVWLAQTRANPVAVMAFAIFFLWGFGYETVVARLRIHLNGTIISSRDVPPSRGSVRDAVCVARTQWTQKHLYSWSNRCLVATEHAGRHVYEERARAPVLRQGWASRGRLFNSVLRALVLALAVTLLIWGLFLWRAQTKRAY
jgi:hypothetical protein